jgi:hypothetical protein
MERILRVHTTDKHTIIYELTETTDNGDVRTYKKELPLGEDLINFIDNDYKVCKTIADCTSPENINPLLWVLYRDKENITNAHIKDCEELKCYINEFFSSVERNEIDNDDMGIGYSNIIITANPIKGGFYISFVVEPDDIRNLVSFAFCELLRNGFRFMRCKLCDKLYINVGKTDYVYCNRMYDGGENTCREIGANIVFNKNRLSDPVSFEYGKVYRRFYARKMRGKMSDEDFKAWSIEASDVFAAYKDGRYSGEDFTNWLNTSTPTGREDKRG